MSRARLTLVALAVLVALNGCTAPSRKTASTPVSPAFPSPVEGRVTLTCEHLSHHPTLRPFISEADDEFPHNASGGNDHNHCLLFAKVQEPVRGMLVFKLTVDALDVDDEPQDFGTPDPSLCRGEADCWIGGPDDCTLDKKPPNEDFRNFVVVGRSLPYQAKVELGVWPVDFKRDLCKADRWSKATATELLNDALRYLQTGTGPPGG